MRFFSRTTAAVLLSIFAPSSVYAAVLFPEPRQIEIAPGSSVEIGIFIDTQDEDINAMEGVIAYPEDILELKEVRDGNSIINFWVERPDRSQSPVAFSGIIPGGFRFPKGFILSLVFEGKKSGQGVIDIRNARVLRNDGEGTSVPLNVPFSSVIVSESAAFPPPVAKITDVDPPEPFVPALARDPSVFDGKWFLSFATQDKGSGLDHFEIRETYAWGRGPWVRAKSPYVLRGQDPSRAIQVKAVDRAGNVRAAMTSPQKIARSVYEIYATLGILLVVILFFAARNIPWIRSLFRKK